MVDIYMLLNLRKKHNTRNNYDFVYHTYKDNAVRIIFFLVSIMSMIYYTLFVEVGFLGKHSTYVVNFVVYCFKLVYHNRHAAFYKPNTPIYIFKR